MEMCLLHGHGVVHTALLTTEQLQLILGILKDKEVA
jgi:hypothetical protein